MTSSDPVLLQKQNHDWRQVHLTHAPHTCNLLTASRQRESRSVVFIHLVPWENIPCKNTWNPGDALYFQGPYLGTLGFQSFHEDAYRTALLPGLDYGTGIVGKGYDVEEA